ncbi:MAG: hypothetical protein Q9162_002381 [Coniocarpon cinnabarinum]
MSEIDLRKPEGQRRKKAELKLQYKEAKARARTHHENFTKSLKTYAEGLGYEFEGPPSPVTGIPNLKVYDVDDVSSNDGFEDVAPPKPVTKKRPLESLFHDEDNHGARTDARSPESVRPERDRPSSGRKIPGSILRGTFLSAMPSRPVGNGGAKKDTPSSPPATPLVSPPVAANPSRPDLGPTHTSPTDNAWGNKIPWLAAMSSDASKSYDRSMNAQFGDFKDCVRKCQNPARAHMLEENLERVREYLHKFRHFEPNEKTIKASGILGQNSGLPVLFSTNSAQTFPFDLRADGKELAVRWRLRQFDPDILRDVEFKGIKGSKSTKLREDRTRIRADSVGQGDLVNGQWFASWLCLVRDGAHGSPQAGIYGKDGYGAFSIVMAGGGHYDDIDEGDHVEYCGASAADGSTEDAQSTALLRSNKGHPERPVRVIRSSKMKSSRYKPEEGLRYDGLYLVTDERVISQEKHEYVFIMRRCPNQDPIRCEGPARRPTGEELDKFRKHKMLLKLNS